MGVKKSFGEKVKGINRCFGKSIWIYTGKINNGIEYLVLGSESKNIRKEGKTW